MGFPVSLTTAVGPLRRRGSHASTGGKFPWRPAPWPRCAVAASPPICGNHSQTGPPSALIGVGVCGTRVRVRNHPSKQPRVFELATSTTRVHERART